MNIVIEMDNRTRVVVPHTPARWDILLQALAYQGASQSKIHRFRDGVDFPQAVVLSKVVSARVIE